MRQILLAVLMTGFSFSYALSQAPQKPKVLVKPEEQLMQLNRVWAEAITKGDAAALDRLFADDMIVTSGAGTIRDKAAEIKDATSGSTDPDFEWTRPFTTEEVRVKVYKDAAVVTGIAKWSFKYKGQEVNQERRYTNLYVKASDEWRIVAQHLSSNLFRKK